MNKWPECQLCKNREPDVWHTCEHCEIVNRRGQAVPRNYMPEEVKVDIMDVTRTKGGHEVKIWEVINGLAWGRIYYGVIRFATWDIDTGKVRFVSDLIPTPHGSMNNLDLDLADWKDKIPWEHIIDKIVFVAANEDGKWKGFACDPIRGCTEYFARIGRSYCLDAHKMPKPPDD